MSDKKPVVVYGASGYTGRLVCEYLRELHLPFIAAGRDARAHAGGDGQDPRHRNRRLRSRRGRAQCRRADQTVPRRQSRQQYGRPVQQIWAGGRRGLPRRRLPLHRHDRRTGLGARRQDALGRRNSPPRACCSSPGIAQMYTTGEIAANICLETPGLDTLDILVLWKGFPTYASTQTIFAILQAKWYYLEQNKFVEWPQNTHFDVNVPGQHAACAGDALGRHLASRLVQGRSEGRQLQGARRRLRARSDGRLRRDAENVRGADQAAAARRSSRRRSPISPLRSRAACRRAKIRASTFRSIRSMPRARSGARIA